MVTHGKHITFVDEAADIPSGEILRLMGEAMQKIQEDGTFVIRVSHELIYDQAGEIGVSFQHAARWYGIDWKA